MSARVPTTETKCETTASSFLSLSVEQRKRKRDELRRDISALQERLYDLEEEQANYNRLEELCKLQSEMRAIKEAIDNGDIMLIWACRWSKLHKDIALVACEFEHPHDDVALVFEEQQKLQETLQIRHISVELRFDELRIGNSLFVDLETWQVQSVSSYDNPLITRTMVHEAAKHAILPELTNNSSGFDYDKGTFTKSFVLLAMSKK